MVSDAMPAPAARSMLANLSPGAVAVLLWVVFAGLSLLQAVIHPQMFSLSTDDAMRLAEVRDLLAGQNWFDLTQHRMNVPFGVPMHWSRLVDGPIALLILFFRSFLGQAAGETAALWTWPLLVALPVFLGVTRVARNLAGREAGFVAAVFTIACVPLTALLKPDSIDHDGVQMALCIWALACLTQLPSRRAAAGAAVLSALSLGVGLDTFPFVFLACCAVCALWVWRPQSHGRAAQTFGLTFAAACIALFFGATAAHEQTFATCDDYSLFYAILSVTGGLGLAALSTAPLKRTVARAAALASLFALLFAVAWQLAPNCFGGPYAQVDPMLKSIWLSGIAEVMPAWKIFQLNPVLLVNGYFYALVGTAAAVALVFLTAPAKRMAAALVALTALVALAIATVEIRGQTFALLFALPSAASLCAIALKRIQASRLSPVFGGALALLLAFGLSEAGFYLAGAYAARAETQAQTDATNFACFSAQSVGALRIMPMGIVASFVDQGPAILDNTADSVLAGPYHRDAAGIEDTYAIFTSAPAKARAVLARRRVSFIVACPSSPDYAFYLRHGGKEGLLSQLSAGHVPQWLIPLSRFDRTHRLMIYRVAAAADGLAPVAQSPNTIETNPAYLR